MSPYIVTAAQHKLFTLSRQDRFLGSLTYKSWFSSQAIIELDDKQTYAVQPKGVWGTTIDVKAGEAVLYNFEMKWDGQIVIRNKASDADSAFTFNYKSVTKNTFALVGQDGNELLLIEPGFTWNKLSYDYQLTASATFEDLPDKALVLLIAVHCANYCITTMFTTTAIVMAS